MKITFNSTNSFANTSFKAKTNDERTVKYQKYLEKNEYLEKKIKPFNNVIELSLLTSLLLGVHNIEFDNKLNTKQKIAVSALGICLATFIAKLITKEKLSKEYDTDVNN